MSVYTETMIRKFYKEMALADKGVFKLGKNEKLTPAARSFLTDRHIHIVPTDHPENDASLSPKKMAKDVITTLEDSVVYPLLFRLTKLYPFFLKSQRELYLAFQNEKCEQVGQLLKIIESMVGHVILEDLSEYNDSLQSNTDLEAIRINRQLDQQHVSLTYDTDYWKLVCYSCYIELVLIRREFEQVINVNVDPFAKKIIDLLKSLEVLLWLVSSE